MKYAINRCYGGFGLSQKAIEWLIDVKGWKVGKGSPILKTDNGYILVYGCELEFRCNKDIIESIELMGKEANGEHADIKLVECPLGPNEGIEIDEYDGVESIQTIPKRW